MNIDVLEWHEVIEPCLEIFLVGGIKPRSTFDLNEIIIIVCVQLLVNISSIWHN